MIRSSNRPSMPNDSKKSPVAAPTAERGLAGDVWGIGDTCVGIGTIIARLSASATQSEDSGYRGPGTSARARTDGHMKDQQRIDSANLSFRVLAGPVSIGGKRRGVRPR